MRNEPKLPTPQIKPEEVAKAILDAAENPTRDKKVGSMSVINTMMAKIAPGVGKKISAKQMDRQQYHEMPRHPEGALYQPSEAPMSWVKLMAQAESNRYSCEKHAIMHCVNLPF